MPDDVAISWHSVKEIATFACGELAMTVSAATGGFEDGPPYGDCLDSCFRRNDILERAVFSNRHPREGGDPEVEGFNLYLAI